MIRQNKQKIGLLAVSESAEEESVDSESSINTNSLASYVRGCRHTKKCHQ